MECLFRCRGLEDVDHYILSELSDSRVFFGYAVKEQKRSANLMTTNKELRRKSFHTMPFFCIPIKSANDKQIQ